MYVVSIPVAARSKVWICRRTLFGIAGSNPTGSMDFCHECFVLSDRGLCNELLTHPEKSYQVWLCLSVVVNPRKWGGLNPLEGCCAMVQKMCIVP
jgi:hypothetical protein